MIVISTWWIAPCISSFDTSCQIISSSRVSLDISTIDILDQAVLCPGACPLHCGSIPGLYPLDASSTPQLEQPSKSPDNAKCPQGAKSLLVEDRWPRTTARKKFGFSKAGFRGARQSLSRLALASRNAMRATCALLVVISKKVKEKTGENILMIYLIEPHISKILSFQHVSNRT